MAEFSVVTETHENPRIIVIKTTGYLEDKAGEKIKSIVQTYIDKGEKRYIFHLGGSPIINSTGISCILELTEEITCELQGRLAFCCLSKAINDVFKIMNLSSTYPVLETFEAAVAEVSR